MKPIPKEVAQKLNQLSHRAALRYEDQLRQSLLTKFRGLANQGLPAHVLFQHLNDIEMGPLGFGHKVVQRLMSGARVHRVHSRCHGLHKPRKPLNPRKTCRRFIM